MANPFVSQNNTNINNINMNNIKSMYQTIMNSRNPQQMFMQLAQGNPQLQPIVNALRNGGNPQQIFYNLCNQRGINPQEFIRTMTGNNTNSR